MSKYFGILIVLGLILLVPHAMALDAANVTWGITESGITDGWLVAGGTETATVTVKIPSSVTLFSATFSIENGLGSFGTVEYPSVSSYNVAKTVFTPATVSGKGRFSVTLVTSDGSDTFTYAPYMQIDHNTPYEVGSINYTDEAQVSTTTWITVRMVDQFGNIVDSKKDTEYIRFSCSPSSALFTGADPPQHISAGVDANGNASVEFQLSPVAGENIIFIDPVPTRPSDQWIIIYGLGNPYPSAMSVIVLPASHEVPIGGSTFTVIYTLVDEYGNPSPNSNLTLLVEVEGKTSEQHFKTNDMGEVTLKYGPQNSVGPVVLSATTNNPAVFDETKLWFVWPSGYAMQLSAIPEIMPSLDIDSSIKSELIVSLTGGDIGGKTVRFEIIDTVFEPGSVKSFPQLMTSDYILRGNGPIDITTDPEGRAILYFIPGEFNEPTTWMNATSTVRAEWLNATGVVDAAEIQLKWMNEPYISVETRLDPDKVAYAPGETVFVEIWLKGDGLPILVNKPVDVVLSINRGDSTFNDMYYNGNQYSEDKLVWAVWGAMGFANTIQSPMGGANQLGLVTYGPSGSTAYPDKLPGVDNTKNDDSSYINDPVLYPEPGWDPSYIWLKGGHYPGYPKPYSGYATVDQSLNDLTSNFQYTLTNTTPSSTSGGRDLCPMRYALYESVHEIIAHGQSKDDTVRAIVLLTDREWDSGGDILAGGSWNNDTKIWSPEVQVSGATTKFGYEDWPQSGVTVQYWPFDDWAWDNPNQNMAKFAKNNDIKVYVIAYPDKANNIATSVQEALKALAYSTGGKYYLATSGEEIYADFQAIADELKIAAAVNTSMTVDFVQPLPDEPPLSYTVDEIFNYTANAPDPMHESAILTDESTVIRHWNWTEGTGGIKNVYSGLKVRNEAIDQTSDWETDQTLEFGEDLIGTINVKETWMTRFGLEINETLNETLIFNLFGPTTKIEFQYGDEIVSVPFPGVTLIVDPGMAPVPDIDAFIDVANLQNGTITLDVVPLEWDLAYNGTDSTITQVVEVRDLYGGWNKIMSQEIPNCSCHQTYNWIISDQPIGSYKVRVTAISDDAGFDREEITVDTRFLYNPPFIKIE